MKNSKLVMSIIISVCFLLSAIAIGIAYYQTKKPAKTVSVVGLAEQDVVSDLIVWNLEYSVTNGDMQMAYNQVKEQSQIVKKFLKDKGIAEEDIDFRNISTEPQNEYRWDDVAGHSVQIFSGYRAEQKIRIASYDVEKVEEVIREISELYDQNIRIYSYEPEYYYTRLSGLKLKLLAEASKNASDRAKTIAENAGGKLGGIKSVTSGVFQITAPNSSEDSYTWGGAFNTSSKGKRVSINMKLTYYVK